MTDTRSEFISKTKENLDLLNARIVELEAKANEKTGEVRREFKAKISGLRESKAQADRRLEELRLASKPAWEDVKKGVEQAWHSLSDAVDSASSRFQ
jgi:BMFP domain-containing protein YqiC